LVSRKEIEELKEESQDFWRFMRGCGEAWKKTCYDMHGRIFKGALFWFYRVTLWHTRFNRLP